MLNSPINDFFSAFPGLLDLTAILFGLIVGSFLNVCIYRLPHDLSVVKPRSQCPVCGKMIAWYDNFPILSYLFLLGKCRYCHTAISFRYPLIEAVTGLISWVLIHRFGPSWLYLVYFLYSAALITITMVDLDHRIIPDEISLPGIPIGLVLAAFTPLISFWDALAGVFVGGGLLLVVGIFYEGLRKQEGIGGGDIKLLGMIGAFTGWQGALFTIFGGSIIASVAGISLMIVRRTNSQIPIPFGPYLSGASFVYLLYGKQLITAYLNLIR